MFEESAVRTQLGPAALTPTGHINDDQCYNRKAGKVKVTVRNLKLQTFVSHSLSIL